MAIIPSYTLWENTALSSVVSAPTGLGVTAQVGGGTFAAATYFWKVTATNAAGETVGSNEVTVAIALNGSALLTWSAATGATGYSVYRSTTTNTELFIAAVGNVLTYTDTGTAGGAAIPTTNTASIGLLSPFFDTNGFSRVLPFLIFAGGTSVHSIEGSFDGVTADADFGYAAPTTATEFNILSPYIRWRTVQTVANATKSKVFLKARL